MTNGTNLLGPQEAYRRGQEISRKQMCESVIFGIKCALAIIFTIGAVVGIAHFSHLVHTNPSFRNSLYSHIDTLSFKIGALSAATLIGLIILSRFNKKVAQRIAIILLVTGVLSLIAAYAATQVYHTTELADFWKNCINQANCGWGALSAVGLTLLISGSIISVKVLYNALKTTKDHQVRLTNIL